MTRHKWFILAFSLMSTGTAILKWVDIWICWVALLVGFCMYAILVINSVLRPYRVQEGTLQVVMRFGKYVRADKSGLHWLGLFSDLAAVIPEAEQTERYAKEVIVCQDGVRVTLDMVMGYKLGLRETQRAIEPPEQSKGLILDLIDFLAEKGRAFISKAKKKISGLLSRKQPESLSEQPVYRAIFGVKDWKQGLDGRARATLHHIVSQKSVKQIMREREYLSGAQDAIDRAVQYCGISCDLGTAPECRHTIKHRGSKRRDLECKRPRSHLPADRENDL